MTGHRHGIVLDAHEFVSARSAASIGLQQLPVIGEHGDIPVSQDALDTLRKMCHGTAVCPTELGAYARRRLAAFLVMAADLDADMIPALVNGLVIDSVLVGYHAHRLQTQERRS